MPRETMTLTAPMERELLRLAAFPVGTYHDVAGPTRGALLTRGLVRYHPHWNQRTVRLTIAGWRRVNEPKASA